MRPGENGELIFEGQTEARVAAQMLQQDYLAVAPHIQPGIAAPHMGKLEFWFNRYMDIHGNKDHTDYVINDPRIIQLAEQALSAAVRTQKFYTLAPTLLSRRKFLAQRVNVYLELRER